MLLNTSEKAGKINKDNMCKNIKRLDNNYRVVDKVMLNSNADFKYETSYNGKIEMIHCRENGTVTLQCGAKRIR